MKRFLRTLVLFTCAVGLVTLAAFVLPGSALALPAFVAGVGSFALGLA